MRWILYTISFILVSSCISPAQQAPTAVPCPAVSQLSSSEERKAVLAPLARGLSREKQVNLVALLKLWALDMAEILAAYKQLELRAGCEGLRAGREGLRPEPAEGKQDAGDI